MWTKVFVITLEVFSLRKKTKNMKINGCHNTVCRLEDIQEFIYNINTCNLYDHEVTYRLFHQSIYIL